MKARIALTLAALASAPLSARVAEAATPPQLLQLLDAADHNNWDRRISAEQLNKSEWDFRQAWFGLFPTLLVQGQWTNNQYPATAAFPDPSTGTLRSLVIVPKDQLDATIRAEWVVLDATKFARIGASGALESAAHERDRVTADLVKRQVAAAFYNYASALRVIESAQKSLQAAQAQLQVQSVRAETGSITELDLQRSKAEVARNQQTVADATMMLEVARRNLETMTGAPPPTTIELGEPDLSDERPQAELEPATQQMPMVLASQHELKAQSRSSLAAKLTLVPTITVNFTERFTNATGFQGRDALYSFGASALWRFDVSAFAAMKAQSAGEQAAEFAAERARAQSRDQLHSDYQRFLAARIKVTAAGEQKKAAERAAQVARSRYDVGAATQVDLIQAERDLFLSEVSEIQARSELGTARVAVRLSAGEPLK